MSGNSSFSEPTVLIEFIPFPITDLARLYECPICKALVTWDGIEPHADWHSGERARNFGGF